MIEWMIETATKRYPLLLGDGAARELPSLLRSLACLRGRSFSSSPTIQ
ncbi:hypothetical protein LR69_00921 [Geobacillus sp. BCO2]|nr:hypothetical protein LR69_00921 [Geobacillus sp. BCO2]